MNHFLDYLLEPVFFKLGTFHEHFLEFNLIKYDRIGIKNAYFVVFNPILLFRDTFY
jgi:hypothetical protein